MRCGPWDHVPQRSALNHRQRRLERVDMTNRLTTLELFDVEVRARSSGPCPRRPARRSLTTTPRAAFRCPDPASGSDRDRSARRPGAAGSRHIRRGSTPAQIAIRSPVGQGPLPHFVHTSSSSPAAYPSARARRSPRRGQGRRPLRVDPCDPLINGSADRGDRFGVVDGPPAKPPRATDRPGPKTQTRERRSRAAQPGGRHHRCATLSLRGRGEGKEGRVCVPACCHNRHHDDYGDGNDRQEAMT